MMDMPKVVPDDSDEFIFRPTAASFLVSEQCNMRCKYCFELGSHSNKFMTKETAEKGLRFLFDNAIKNNEDCISITLFGGEPLMNLDVCEFLLETGYRLSKETGKVFTTTLITNGTIMNDKVEAIFGKWWEKCHLNVQISVDGTKEAHDENRVFANGKGTFDKIVENLPRWKRILKCGDSFNSQLCVHTCLSHSNMPYFYDSWKMFMEDWKTPFIWFMPIHSETWSMEDVKLYKEQLVKIAEILLNKAVYYHNLDWIKSYAPLDKTLMPMCGFGAPCGAGKNFCSITAEGLISPCHQIYYNDPDNFTIIGNVDDGIDYMKMLPFADYDATDLSCFKENPECDCFHCYRCLADNWCRSKSIYTTIRGYRCLMSHIERDIQAWLKEELVKAKLIDENCSEIHGNELLTPDYGDSPIHKQHGDRSHFCDVVSTN